jgi:prepilin-type N-terminal cleavage/methylation domain-containing protein
MKKSKGFTLIEILLILAIVGILLLIIMVNGISGGKDRASTSSYKATMNTLRSSILICGENNINLGAAIIGNGINKVCSVGFDDIVYPEIDAKCGVDEFTFRVNNVAGTWAVSTNEDCRGCKIICDKDLCRPWTGHEDACK